tara:strand:- start:787 stop:1116 length:330 start_codon:yes stop_codon:yes gene_type:complete
MRPVVITVTGVAISAPVTLNYRQSNFKVSIAAVITGTATYTVQHTFDDPADFATEALYNSDADWFDHEFMDAIAVTSDGNYAFPVRASRLNVTASSGSVKATWIQGNAQ